MAESSSWYRRGLLLIGDAAHVMSPVFGVGINYAIQDAVVAANVLGPRLREGDVRMRDLRCVQRRREWPMRVMQWLQEVQKYQQMSWHRLACAWLDGWRSYRRCANCGRG